MTYIPIPPIRGPISQRDAGEAVGLILMFPLLLMIALWVGIGIVLGIAELWRLIVGYVGG